MLMLLQVARSSEVTLGSLAFVRLLTGVNPSVILKLGHNREALSTVDARISFFTHKKEYNK